jgi:hypothetical protein
MKIFINYRRADSADVAGRIYDRLADKFGEDSIFKDVDSIPFGIDFRKHLDNSVKDCQVFLAVIGDEWFTLSDEVGNRRIDDERDWVRIEIESALQRNIPVIPLYVNNTSPPSADQFPDSLKELAYRNGIPVRSDPDFHNDMNRLIKGIDEILGGKSQITETLPPTFESLSKTIQPWRITSLTKKWKDLTVPQKLLFGIGTIIWWIVMISFVIGVLMATLDLLSPDFF